MPLIYGFHFGPGVPHPGSHDHLDEPVKGASLSDQGFSELDIHFFHEVLPFMLMSVGVAFITTATIPIIMERMRLVNGDWLSDINRSLDKFEKGLLLDVYLQKFICFQANVKFEGSAEFKRRMRLKSVTDKQIRDMQRDFEKQRKELHVQRCAEVKV